MNRLIPKRIIGLRNWHRINFNQFSMVLQPEVKEYDFSFENVLENVTQ